MNRPNSTSSTDGEAANTDPIEEDALPRDALTAFDPVREKLADAQTPGYQAEFDPGEAEAAGAFTEDALTEADALASKHDDLHFVRLSSLLKQ
jgi:hypothetical protein